MNYVKSNNLSSKYQRVTPCGRRDKGIRKFEFVAKTQFLCSKVYLIEVYLSCLVKLRLFINTIKAGGPESMYSLGGVRRSPPLVKGLRIGHRVEMHVHTPIFHGYCLMFKAHTAN